MAALAKGWVRIAGVMILAVTLAIFFGFLTWPSGKTAAPENTVLNGLSADIYCEGFFETLLKEDTSAHLGLDTARTEELADAFRTRVRLLAKGTRSAAERDASFEGRLGTVGYIGALDHEDRAEAATALLQRRYGECETRLAAQGVPEAPAPPKVGSSEWHMQNR